MKTALKKLNMYSVAFLAMGAFICGLAGSAPDVYAQTGMAVPPAPVIAPPPVAAPVAAAPVIVPPPASTEVTAGADAEKSDKSEKEVKTIDAAAEKVTDAANAVAKRLSSKESMTLDDLNSTRQTIAKIEALIDLEKRLNELDKIRADRDDKSSSFAGAIPSSALKPYGGTGGQVTNTSTLPMPIPMPTPMAVTSHAVSHFTPPAPTFSNVEIQRVIGSGGRFSAILKTGSGQTKTVQVGDSVDGATVTAITSAGVELSQDKTKRTLSVKNVQTVFGTSP